jgi:hypothetical protein
MAFQERRHAIVTQNQKRWSRKLWIYTLSEHRPLLGSDSGHYERPAVDSYSFDENLRLDSKTVAGIFNPWKQ